MSRKAYFLLFSVLSTVNFLGCSGAKSAPDIRLTKSAGGQVVSITLVGKNVGDSDLKELTKHAETTELKLQECSSITSKGMAAFRGAFPKLVSLELVRVAIDDASLENLANASALSELSLAHTNVTGLGLKHLANCPLKRLSIFSRVVTVDGMKNLASLQQLEQLELHCQDLPLKEMAGIGELKKLKKLVAFRTPVGLRGVEVLRGLDQLESLHLNSVEIDDESIDPLNSLSSLVWAEIDYGSFTNEGIKRLNLPKLKELSLDSCRGITDEGLGNFSGVPALESLMLGGTGVAGKDLTPLATLPNLKSVRLLGSQFRGNDESIRALKAKLPNCEVVIMRG